MLCERCLKNKATVMYEERINGRGQKLNLCDKCAEKLGIINFSSAKDEINHMMKDFMNDFVNPFMCDEIDLFNDFIPFKFIHNEGSNKLNKNNYAYEKCPRCGFSKEDYLRYGKGGCLECYGKFENKVSNNNEKIKLKNLENKLKSCIKSENYEEAAILRDEINKIKNRKEM